MSRVLPVALVCAALAACSSSSDHNCRNADNTPGYCYCPQGQSCEHSCTTEPSCSIDCANTNPSCSISCRDNCTILCQAAGTCTGTCGAGCSVACQGAQSCTVTVGDGGSVRCEQAGNCAVTCTGACSVDCPEGSCRVACADGMACDVICAKGTDAGVTLCPDGKTKTCNHAC